MKYWYLTLLVFYLVACTGRTSPNETGSDEITSSIPTSTPASTHFPVTTPSLPDHGIAPELTNEVWLNTDDPLRLADLRGKVVLLEMWTFG